MQTENIHRFVNFFYFCSLTGTGIIFTVFLIKQFHNAFSKINELSEHH